MMGLDARLIQAQLKDTAPTITCFDAVTSTNSVLKAQMANKSDPQVVLATEQTKGRGRRGRSWLSPKHAGLYMSYGHLSALPAGQLAPLSLVLATSVATALPAPVHIKWPNDLVIQIQDRWAKVGGCLVELSVGLPPKHLAVLGVGLNLRLDATLTDVSAIGQAWANVPNITDINQLAASVIKQLSDDLALFEAYGFDAFNARWAALHVLNGQAVTVTSEDQRFDGVAGEVNAMGQLSVATDRGIEWVSAADVSVRLG